MLQALLAQQGTRRRGLPRTSSHKVLYSWNFMAPSCQRLQNSTSGGTCHAAGYRLPAIEPR